MKTIPLVLFATIALTGCRQQVGIEVANPIDSGRVEEMVEIPKSAYANFEVFEKAFKIVDEAGVEVPYQVTHDGSLIFQVTLAARQTARFSVEAGMPTEPKASVFGKVYPQRVDDLTWENDKFIYRAYGPALQASGERAFGYDLWTKNCDELLAEQRYRDGKERGISLHEDHGKGMDVYLVGPTLGGGTAALLDDDDEIAYPYCYDTCEILDNGPLRFTARLTYKPERIGSDTAVVEHRLITLDRGSLLNRTEVSYTGLSTTRNIAAGIVIHDQNPDGYVSDSIANYIAYADPTDNVNNNNGEIFVAALLTKPMSVRVVPFDEPKGQAVGHILAINAHAPDDVFTYYWGAAWSKAEIHSFSQWQDCLSHYSRCLESPLIVTLK